MDKKNLIKIINKELTIVTDIIQGFENSEHIHPFEIDLAISRIKDIYGELQLLKDDSKEIVIDLDANLPKQDNKKTEIPVIVTETKNESPDSEDWKNITKSDPQSTRQNKNDNTNNSFEEKQEIKTKPIEDTSGINENITNKTTGTSQKNYEHSSENNVSEIEEDKTTNETDEIQEKQEEQSTTKEANASEEINKTVIDAGASDEIEEENPDIMKNTADKNEIIADKFNISPSVNDMLAGFKKNNDLASRLGDRPVESMKKAVKLNDKIWYINELFSRNADTYNQTLDTIDNAKDLDEALAYLFSNFSWDQEKKSTISFLELVFRRFSN